MVNLARAQPELPAATAAARAVESLLSASLIIPGSRILEDGLPVFEYRTQAGLLLRAGGGPGGPFAAGRRLLRRRTVVLLTRTLGLSDRGDVGLNQWAAPTESADGGASGDRDG